MMRTSLFTLLAVFGIFSTAVAGDFIIPGEDKVPLETVPIDDFETNFWIDGWIVQLSLGLEDTAAGFTKDVFIGFGDIISNLDWIVPLGADFRYKRVGFMPDLVAVKISGAGTTPGPFYDRADIDNTFVILNLPAYYRVIDEPNLTFDILGGARFLWVDAEISLSGGPLGDALGQTTAGTQVSVWDGIVGGRIHQKLNDKLFYSIYGDVGTGASELTWQILPSIGYQFTEDFSVAAGYRYIHYKLEDEDANAQLTGSGIQLTINWKF